MAFAVGYLGAYLPDVLGCVPGQALRQVHSVPVGIQEGTYVPTYQGYVCLCLCLPLDFHR